jgi:transcriptional regulator with XRE-family HTH domain
MEPFPPTRLKLIRLSRGLSREALAFQAGLGATSVGAAERGMSSPLILEAIAKALSIEDPRRLLDRIDKLEERIGP